MAKKLISKQAFDFSARVTLQLGRESISSSTVAISELIKNSYDADAENVNVSFHLRSSNAVSTLIIKDDGQGMSEETVMRNWMQIGTDNKLQQGRTSKKNRVFTGAKGLGRLGIDRLCKKLVLYTKKEGDKFCTQLIIDWKKFENTKKTLSQIVHDVYEVDLPLSNKYGSIFKDENDKGTCLVMIGLKDNWDESFIEALSNELRLLISPYRRTNDFNITLAINSGSEKQEKNISSEEILNAASWKVIAKVDEFNRVQAKFINNKTGDEVILAPLAWGLWIKQQGEQPLFGPLSFEFHYIPRDLTELKKINLGQADWKRFMELNRGIRIYRDDFRVRPYGEPTGKGDWLDLGYRRSTSPSAITQGGWRVGPHQIVGAINISKEKNIALEDQTNREGLFENDAFFQMRAFIIKIIEQFEILASKDTVKDADVDLSEELEKTLAQSEAEVNTALTNFKSTFLKKNKPKKKSILPARLAFMRLQEYERAKKRHEEAIEQYSSFLKKEKEKLKGEKDTLANLASIGILSICFGHEIRTHSSLALAHAEEIVNVINDFQNNGKQFNYDQALKSSQKVHESITYVDNFSKLAINNIKPDKRKRKKINVPSVFEYIFNLLDVTLKKMNISYNFNYEKIKSSDFNVRSYEIDWESIAINLITNSMWALENTKSGNRKIIVNFKRIGGIRLNIEFKDSGCGLESGAEESIFLPMNSSKRDRLGNIIGTGMGLAIIKTHIEEHMSGTISAHNDPILNGACFLIEILQDTIHE